MPQPIGAPQQFPDNLPAPSNLRPHLPNQSGRFDYLDDIYKHYHHEEIRDMALLDVNRMVENEPTLSAQDEAFAALQAHCRERMGFVQASSDRLQAATGMRNDHSFGESKFDLPLLSFSVCCVSSPFPHHFHLIYSIEKASLSPEGSELRSRVYSSSFLFLVRLSYSTETLTK
jgi:hypothetical protein